MHNGFKKHNIKNRLMNKAYRNRALTLWQRLFIPLFLVSSLRKRLKVLWSGTGSSKFKLQKA